MPGKHILSSPLLLLAFATLISSCEGFKMLTIYNRTGQDITIQTKQVLTSFNRASRYHLAQAHSGAWECKIPADSSLPILVSFGGLLFNEKIKDTDLPIDYLKIITSKDTIIADSREELLKLAKGDKTKYRRITDKGFAADNNRNMEAIIIRQ